MTLPAIGIDLGGTELRAGIVDPSGKVLARRQVPTDAHGGPDAVIGQMLGLIGALDGAGGVSGLGIASPGPLDPIAGICIAPPTLHGWRDVPLAAILAQRTGLPTRLENDANAAALGEWRAGAGRGLQHLVYVTVSTGLGGGVIADGRLLHGRRGMAGEIGHMSMVDNGPPCPCGGRGCWEALASGTALGQAATLAATLAAAGGAATRLRLPLTARDVTEAARAGDTLALALLHQEAVWLGRGFANLLHLYSPERIIVGGGVSAALDLMLPDILAAMHTAAQPAYHGIDVVPAALGGDAGLIGAASLMWPPHSPPGLSA